MVRSQIPVSVLILTLNEEHDLPRCLETVKWSDDVVVLDSGSSDRTVEIAAAWNCRVVPRKFDNWAAHQNWALQNVEFKNKWVLNLDADERISNEMAVELQRVVSEDWPYKAFRMRRKDYLYDTWLKHATFYPTWLVRLYQPGAVNFRRLVNPVADVDGPVGTLAGHIEHYPFSKGLSHWIARHNSYSTFEAMEYEKRKWPSFGEFLSKDSNRRRQAAKALFARAPFRPVLKFSYLYFVHRGFLDGRPGFTYCLLQSIYEYFISVKIVELRRVTCGAGSECARKG